MKGSHSNLRGFSSSGGLGPQGELTVFPWYVTQRVLYYLALEDNSKLLQLVLFGLVFLLLGPKLVRRSDRCKQAKSLSRLSKILFRDEAECKWCQHVCYINMCECLWVNFNSMLLSLKLTCSSNSFLFPYTNFVCLGFSLYRTRVCEPSGSLSETFCKPK